MRWIIFTAFAVAGTGAWYMIGRSDAFPFAKISESLFIIAGLYLLLRIMLGTFGTKRISDVRAKYRFQKTLSIVYYVLIAVFLIRIWVEDPQALLVSYGIIAAGVTIALQDFFKNFVGGVVVIVNNIYRVGDRVEIDGSRGDVVDIGVLNTTLMELEEWIDGDQATGRFLFIPNGRVISTTVKNYTRDHDFIWDEVTIPITYDSDWRKAGELFGAAVQEITREQAARADRQLRRLASRYYYIEREVDPMVNISPNDNWIDVSVRYITLARSRRVLKTQVFRAVMEIVESEKDIDVASETVHIYSHPVRETRKRKKTKK